MSDKTPRVLTPEEQLLFTTIPDDLSAPELVRYYTFSPEDKAFIFQHRGAANRVGIALQLGLAGANAKNVTVTSSREAIVLSAFPPERTVTNFSMAPASPKSNMHSTLILILPMGRFLYTLVRMMTIAHFYYQKWHSLHQNYFQNSLV